MLGAPSVCTSSVRPPSHAPFTREGCSASRAWPMSHTRQSRLSRSGAFMAVLPMPYPLLCSNPLPTVCLLRDQCERSMAWILESQVELLSDSFWPFVNNSRTSISPKQSYMLPDITLKTCQDLPWSQEVYLHTNPGCSSARV